MDIVLKKLSGIHLTSYLKNVTCRYGEILYATKAFRSMLLAQKKAREDIDRFFPNGAVDPT